MGAINEIDIRKLQDWNGFKFKYIDKSDYSKVLTHLQRNFYADEPINRILTPTPERIADMDQRLLNILDLNHGSFYAYPEKTPDKIAAVMMIYIHEKGNELPHAAQPRSPITVTIGKALEELWRRYNVFEEKGVDNYPELFIISTDHEFRGKGLATEMYRRAIANLKLEGYRLITSEFSNPISRKIGEKLGFREVARLDFDECKHEDGTLVFGEAGKGHYIVTTALDLN